MDVAENGTNFDQHISGDYIEIMVLPQQGPLTHIGFSLSGDGWLDASDGIQWISCEEIEGINVCVELPKWGPK